MNMDVIEQIFCEDWMRNILIQIEISNLDTVEITFETPDNVRLLESLSS